jgi:hypothetical protein
VLELRGPRSAGVLRRQVVEGLLLVVADAGIADTCADRVTCPWVSGIRVRDAASASTFPTPAGTSHCPTGAHSGPHELREIRSGSFLGEQSVFATDLNAGVQVLDPAAPPALRRSAPAPPPARIFDTRSGRPRVIQRCDVVADADLYVTDRDAGRYVLQYEGA